MSNKDFWKSLTREEKLLGWFFLAGSAASIAGAALGNTPLFCGAFGFTIGALAISFIYEQS